MINWAVEGKIYCAILKCIKRSFVSGAFKTEIILHKKLYCTIDYICREKITTGRCLTVSTFLMK